MKDTVSCFPRFYIQQSVPVYYMTTRSIVDVDIRVRAKRVSSRAMVAVVMVPVEEMAVMVVVVMVVAAMTVEEVLIVYFP
jgi:hypothetical protein